MECPLIQIKGLFVIRGKVLILVLMECPLMIKFLVENGVVVVLILVLMECPLILNKFAVYITDKMS